MSGIVYSQSLPSITLANEIQTKPKGVEKANPVSFVTLDFTLYVLGSLFNLTSESHLRRALHCGITFIDDFFLMLDHSTRQMIGTGHESQGFSCSTEDRSKSFFISSY